MIHTEKRMRLCAVLLLVNLVFIWGNSLMPGEVSGQISRWVGEIVTAIFRLPVNESEGGHGLLRKLGHFSEFACLGALLCWRLAMKGESGKNLRSMTLLGVMLAACIDETIQTMVPDRGPSVIDVWIDTCGGLTGMALLLTGHHLIQKRKSNLTILEETT